MCTAKETYNFKLREKGYGERDGFEIPLFSENRISQKYAQLEIVSGRDPSITMIISGRDHSTTIISIAAGKGSPKRVNPAMRAEHTHAQCDNFKLREKGYAERDGFEMPLRSENQISQKYAQLGIVSGRDPRIITMIISQRDPSTTIITIAASKGGSEKRKNQQ